MKFYLNNNYIDHNSHLNTDNKTEHVFRCALSASSTTPKGAEMCIRRNAEIIP